MVVDRGANDEAQCVGRRLLAGQPVIDRRAKGDPD
jgi:hypothetical protein